MSLAIFDVTAGHARVGTLFDTSKKYVYRDPQNGGSPSVIRMPLGQTIANSGRNLTFSFDGDTYFINSALAVSGSTIYLGVL